MTTVGDRYPGRGVDVSVGLRCAGLREVVRYVVRLREVMEIVRRCKLNARLGIVNRINKAGVRAGSAVKLERVEY